MYNTTLPYRAVSGRCQDPGEPGGSAARLDGRGRAAGREQRAGLPSRLHRVDHLDQHAHRHHHVRRLVHHRLRLLPVHHRRVQLAPALWINGGPARLAAPAPAPALAPAPVSVWRGPDLDALPHLLIFLLIACYADKCCNVQYIKHMNSSEVVCCG